MSMVVMVPSRGRPGNIARLVEGFRTTGAFVDMIVITDADDDTEAYRAACGDEPWVTHIVQPPQKLGPTLNQCAPTLAPFYDVIGFMGDDHLPRTPLWDVEIGEALEGITGVAYGNDLLQGENLATAAFLTSDIVAAIGYFVPPGATHLFLDNFWMTIGQRTSLTYLPGVVIEHLHPVAGTAAMDDTYITANSPENWSHDEALYHAYVADQLESDIAKIKGQ